jgi:hypothetical protein
LGDIGVTADIFRLRQIPSRLLECARRATYLEQECQRIEREMGFATLMRRQVEAEETRVKDRLEASRVYLRIAPHLFYDKEPGEVPSSILYPRLTNRPARYHTVKTASSARQNRRRQAASARQLRREAPIPCLYCASTMHKANECTRPHSRCTNDECTVSPIHMYYEPRRGLCAFFMMHFSDRRMTPQEEDFTLNDYIEEDHLETD